MLSGIKKLSVISILFQPWKMRKYLQLNENICRNKEERSAFARVSESRQVEYFNNINL